MKFFKQFLYSLLCIILFACNGSNNKEVNLATTKNVIPLVVDSGYNGTASNVSFITITICQPNTSNCQTIDHIMVDTGSTGLKINNSSLNLTNLPTINYENAQLYQCPQYGSGYVFGPMVYADLKLSGEVAANLPIQIINDGSQSNVPSSCSEGTSYNNFNNSGAHGIIGINVISNPNNNYNLVYKCTNSFSCSIVESPTNIPTILNINPISTFTNDNNGVILNLPNVLNPTNESLVGTLTFGLNTQSNNIVSKSVHKVLGNPVNLDEVGQFTVYYNGESGNGIFDSGTTALAFYSSNITQCQSESLADLYCPNPSPQSWETNISNYLGGSTIAIVEPIAKYSFSEISEIVVPYLGYIFQGNFTIYGLPFFFGKSIYLGFMGSGTGESTPLGMGPAWGFKNNE